MDAATDELLADRYRLGRLLGRGGMAEVWDAEDLRLHRPVAVKILSEEMAARPDIRARFDIEARAAARLSHPNVVAVYDTGDTGGASGAGRPFLVMERLPGTTMADRMGDGPVDQRWLVGVTTDVLGALDAAHEAGIVHRDIKPANILLDSDGRAKVADFGIAKLAEIDGSVDLTTTKMMVGTPAYLAPERIEGLPATPASDLYSLGVVLYEALAGAKPFSGTTPMAVALAAQMADPAPLRRIRRDVDPRLAAVVTRAMAKDPASRFATAAEMTQALAGVRLKRSADPTVAAVAAGDRTVVAPPAAVPRSRPAPAGLARWRWPLTAVALLGVLLLVLVVRGGGGTGGTAATGGARAATPLGTEMRALADRLGPEDGRRAPEAGERLDALADEVDSGGGGESASRLMADVVSWRSQNLLGPTATAKVTALLQRVPGMRPPATVAPTTTARPAIDVRIGGKGKGKGRGD
ncbi:MAG TPA: serine/threonine-protein kinase [Acidimicrobiales bacterium]|nr:serine/threonine-protein kinase [Acidimicrobiales bacterium]